MSSDRELFLLKLRNLIAEKEHLTARLNRDVAQFGSAQGNYEGWWFEVDAEIKSLIEREGGAE